MRQVFCIVFCFFSLCSNAQFAEIMEKTSKNPSSTTLEVRNHKADATLSQITQQISGIYRSYYKDGALFNGTVWSNDRKTLWIHFMKGKPVEYRMFHNNGKLAIRIVNGSQHTIEDYYDDKFNYIKKSEFVKEYPYNDFMKRLNLLDTETQKM